MAGARYTKFDYTMTDGTPWTIYPAALSLTDGIAISNVRGFTVGLMGPANGQLQGGALRGYVLVPSNVLVNNAPESATMRWVRCPSLDVQDLSNARDACGYFDVTAKGIVAFRAACLPEAVVYDVGTTVTLLYSARYWGI